MVSQAVHGTVEDNKRQMQVSDDAFIARDIARINHTDDAKMHMPWGVEMDMAGKPLEGSIERTAFFSP